MNGLMHGRLVMLIRFPFQLCSTSLHGKTKPLWYFGVSVLSARLLAKNGRLIFCVGVVQFVGLVSVPKQSLGIWQLTILLTIDNQRLAVMGTCFPMHNCATCHAWVTKAPKNGFCNLQHSTRISASRSAALISAWKTSE